MISHLPGMRSFKDLDRYDTAVRSIHRRMKAKIIAKKDLGSEIHIVLLDDLCQK